MSPRQFRREHKIEQEKRLSSLVRKHLGADALICAVRACFEQVDEILRQKPVIALEDALMSAFAMFSLKDPSLLAFEQRRMAQPHNLNTIYRLKAIPSDTQMRAILDQVSPAKLRPAFNSILGALQRGKAFEKMLYLEEGYLMPIDGTGYFSSEKLFSDYCLTKVSSTGKITYSLQMLGAALVHPEQKAVIPLFPEIISRQDGSTKNDCEMNASRRLIINFKREHPHLKIVVTQDAISPNGPYIRFIKEIGYHFILTVKEADHGHLFARFDEAVKTGAAEDLIIDDPENPKRFHYFHWFNDLPINASHPDIRVNILEYYEVTGDARKRFCWVTDIPLNSENVYQIMRAGRAHWKIENETFNTLKNQGYNFEHNYGLGQKYLSMVFVTLMMLAFLVDQTQQLCCTLFQSVLKKLGSKRALWENMRSLFHWFRLESMEMLYLVLLNEVKAKSIFEADTS